MLRLVTISVTGSAHSGSPAPHYPPHYPLRPTTSLVSCPSHIVAAIHRALHTRPLPTTVASGFGILDVHKSKSYDGAYVQMNGVTFLSANPEKDSKWGRKTRAGGCITFINNGVEGKARTYQYGCTAIESVGSTGACTVSKQGFFTVTDQGQCAICPFNSGDLSRTVADPGQQDEDGRPVKKPKPNGKGGPACVEYPQAG